MVRMKLSTLRYPFWVLATLLFTAIQVRQSLHGGRLALPPTFGDIAQGDVRPGWRKTAVGCPTLVAGDRSSRSRCRQNA